MVKIIQQSPHCVHHMAAIKTGITQWHHNVAIQQGPSLWKCWWSKNKCFDFIQLLALDLSLLVSLWVAKVPSIPVEEEDQHKACAHLQKAPRKRSIKAKQLVMLGDLLTTLQGSFHEFRSLLKTGDLKLLRGMVIGSLSSSRKCVSFTDFSVVLAQPQWVLLSFPKQK